MVSFLSFFFDRKKPSQVCLPTSFVFTPERRGVSAPGTPVEPAQLVDAEPKTEKEEQAFKKTVPNSPNDVGEPPPNLHLSLDDLQSFIK